MIAIYSEIESPRLQYIATELFETMHGLNVSIVTNYEEFRQMPTDVAKICYSQQSKGIGLHIRPEGLLFESGITTHKINDVTTEEGLTFFFCTGNHNTGTFLFDIFAASFYLLSRYEEYLSEDKDQHGRYKASDSLAFKHGFLEEPVIDQWMKVLLNKLYALYPSMDKSHRTFRHIKTIDVDNVYAYRHKGPIVNGLHLLKDAVNGNWKLFKQRLKVVLRLQEDPFFNLEELSNTLLPYSKNTIFFFHCGCYGKYDKKVWVPSCKYARIRKDISEHFAVGLHPSYRSAHKTWIFNIEKSILEKRIKREVKCCRAHYLLFNFPDDYRRLISIGICDDYTMGYSNNPGFRAGTSMPFHFYDIEKEESTPLLIHPLAVMDKTLHSNLGLTADEAKSYIIRLGKKVKAVNGDFVTLFHNENQTDEDNFGWKGWKAMYKNLISEL